MGRHRFCWVTIVILPLLFNLWSCQRSDTDLRQEAKRSDQAFRQYRTADYVPAKSALLEFAHQLDKLLAGGSTVNAEVYKSDSMVTYVRLAKLEEKNNGSEREAFMKEAVIRCQQLNIKWGKCSAQELRDRVDRIDSVPPK